MELLDVLARRRSVRRFKPLPLPEEDLEKLLFALQRAPTDASAQLYSAIRVRDPRLRDEVARLSGDQEHIRQAAEFFLFLADVHRLERLLAHRGQRMAFWPRTALHFAILDAGIAASYLALTAEALGYGVCFIGGVLNGVETLTDLLGLPRGSSPWWGLPLGCPTRRAPRGPGFPGGSWSTRTATAPTPRRTWRRPTGPWPPTAGWGTGTGSLGATSPRGHDGGQGEALREGPFPAGV